MRAAIYLPAETEEPEEAMSDAHVFRDGLAPRVAIIEDSQLAREALASYLTGLGYDIATASNGIEGVKLVAARPPHAIILDIDMPDMNGIDFLRRLRASPSSRAIQVMVTSGLVGARDRQRAFEAGCNQYIVKPFTLASIGRALWTYFWKLGIALDG